MIYLIDKGPTRPTGEDRYSMMIQPDNRPVSLGGQTRVIWYGEDVTRCREYINNLRELDRKRGRS